SFLFTAYAITLNGVAAGPGGAMTGRQAMLCRLIPLIGVATTGLIYTGLIASARATAWLRGTLRARIADETQLGLPPVQAPDAIGGLRQLGPRVRPLGFLTRRPAVLVARRGRVTHA